MQAARPGDHSDNCLELGNDRVILSVSRTDDGQASINFGIAGLNGESLFSGGPLLAFNGKEAHALPFDRATHTAIGTADASIILSGAWRSFTYELAFQLPAGTASASCQVRFRTNRPVRGWFHSRCGGPATGHYWIYPWLNDGKDIVPTLGAQRLHMDVPGHIHAELAGIPLIVVRHGSMIGGLGFGLDHNYHHDSLAFERNASTVSLGVGSGRNEGPTAFHGQAQYRPGVDYTFSFQLLALDGGFRELALAWQQANRFCFDRSVYYSLEEALEMATVAREPAVYAGTERYIRQQVRDKAVRGYRHSSHQQRISVYRQSLNAYVDYLLYVRSGKALFLDRAVEQLEFLLASQTADGWFQEDWQIAEEDYSYEVIGQDGGVTQVMAQEDRMLDRPDDNPIWGQSMPGVLRVHDPVTGRNIKGPRPDYLGITCLYMHKLILSDIPVATAVRETWRQALDRCLTWIMSTQNADGSFPMTVANDLTVKADIAPCSRLLLALDRIATDRGDTVLATGCRRHEQWVIEYCVKPQRWWGSHKDTGLTIDYGGLQTFIQYCIQCYEHSGEKRYIDLASECTYFNFFEHCPKQLEWLWHYSKGGIQEQSNYLQPDIDTMDNLVLSSWYRLASISGDDFLRGFVDQQVFTTMHTLCDDPENAWYGTWSQYLVDYAGAVKRYDQSPVTENRTKYAGSITPHIIEDFLLLLEAGYSLPS
jgi:hypothetical protein